MQYLPMDLPAEIVRRGEECELSDADVPNVVVARGPLVIMMHGLAAIDRDHHDACWISSPMGNLSASDATDMLKRWSVGH